MRHLDGIAVTLHAGGRAVPEYSNPYCKKTQYVNRTIGSRGVTLKTGSRFEVRLEVDHSFQLHKWSGISVVIAFHPDHYEEQGTDLAQVWWIPLKSAGKQSEYVFRHTITWNKSGVDTKFIPYSIPAPAENSKDINDDWLFEDVYMAGRGCISVHVQRGHVDLRKAAKERPDDFYRDRTNVEPNMNALIDYGNSAYPIRLDWFFRSRSEEYVFEFRNLQAKEIDRSTAGIYEFNDETGIEASDSEEGSIMNDDEVDNSDWEYEEEVDEEEEVEDEEEENEHVSSRTNVITVDAGSRAKSAQKQRRSHRPCKKIHESLQQPDVIDFEGDTSISEHHRSERMLRLQTPTSSNKQTPRISKSHREMLSTPPNETRLQTSSAIKRKLDDCDGGDDEIIPRLKPKQPQALQPPAQELPTASQDSRSGSSRPSSKRTKLVRELELLRIQKRELELLTQLDELDD